MALGIALVCRSSGVPNVSASTTGVAGAFVLYGLRDKLDVDWPAALVVGLLTAVALGILIQVGVMTLLRTASTLVKLIAALGAMSLVRGGVSIVWGPEDRPPPTSILPAGAKHSVHLFGSDELIRRRPSPRLLHDLAGRHDRRGPVRRLARGQGAPEEQVTGGHGGSR